ncbi:MAG: hypothetical protein H3C62_03925 [Gemmatimonadaceae bacterium]|nr:hypothetical protein [Gemmatimonadaceae bacterium]
MMRTSGVASRPLRLRLDWRRLSILAGAVALTLEHTEPSPARLVPASRVVVANGPATFLLKVAVLNRRGDTLSPRGLRFSALDAGIVNLPHPGQARCLRQGDARVVVRQGRQAAALLVKCRPIESFGMPWLTRLEVGQSPVLPTIVAYDSSGALIDEFSGTATIRDPTVVRYAGGMLHPLRVGGTYLDIDFGGIATHLPVQVVDRVVDKSLDLAAGEIRTWPLPRGRSELILASDSTDPEARHLQLYVHSANCARSRARAAEQHWYCIGTGASRAIVTDTRRIGEPGSTRGRLTMWAMK